GKGALAMSVAPENGRNRIMIYGPKNDGTYVVEFKTTAGEALAISIPRAEASVIRHFQLILKRASASRPSGEWSDDDYDVLCEGAVVGRIFKSAAAPVGTPMRPGFMVWEPVVYRISSPVLQ